MEKNTRRSARRLDRATNQLGLRLPSHRQDAPGGAGGGRPAPRRAGAAGALGREAGRIDTAQSLPTFRSTSPASPPGGPGAARASGSTVLWPLLWHPRELRAPARGPPPFPHSYKPQPTPFPDPLFRPPSQTHWQFSPQGLGVLDSSFPDQPFLIKSLGLGVGAGGSVGENLFPKL